MSTEDTLATITAALEAMPKHLEEKKQEFIEQRWNEEAVAEKVGETRAGLVKQARIMQESVEAIRLSHQDEPFDRIEVGVEHIEKRKDWDAMNAEQRQVALHEMAKGEDDALAEAIVSDAKRFSVLSDQSKEKLLARVYGEERIEAVRKNVEMRNKANRVLAAIERTIHGLR